MSSKHTDSIKRLLASHGSQTAAELSRALGISQPTLSRAIKASHEILSIGRTRTARYALPSSNLGGDGSWGLYQIDAQGQAKRAGLLHALCQGEFYFESELEPGSYSYLFNGDAHPRLFPDLPWFLDEMRPQGYMGRLFAHAYGPSLGIGENPENWTFAEALTAILRFGSDTPGNFVLGGEAIDQVQSGRQHLAFVDESDREEQFDLISRNLTEEGELPNSSAGGEQPKFTARIRRDDGAFSQVIVKFSGSLQTEVGRRWADLLRAEALASRILNECGLSAARTQIVETEEHVYLEVERFDRFGRIGRAGVLSLRTVITGRGGALEHPWSKVVLPLVRDGWLSQSDADQVARLEWFGHLIGNTDMHHGNLSLHLTPTLPLRLCPAYDMLPMFYAPSRMGDMPTKPIATRLPRPEALADWCPAAHAALRFWTELDQEPKISPSFKAALNANRASIQDQLDRYGN